ncbi:MAG: alpha/beta hydrolase [Planctomycetia bacterium]|nr:alpha/beta hydrolase [Planctomycetia bacterium]
MKRTLLSLSIFLLLCVVPVFAEQILRDLPYYDATFQGSGDLAYRDQRCKLDIYLPDMAEGEKLPVVVWFHGGGLSGGNKHFPAELKKQRFLIVAVSYRLSPKANCPDYIQDAAAAVAWTMKNIEKYGGDAKKVCVSGHSAGGYLTAMVAMDSQYLELFGCKNTEIAAAFPISGQMATHFQIMNERRGKNMVPYNPIVVDAYAPLALTARELPPMYLYVGDPKIEWKARVEENALLAAMIQMQKEHKTIEFHSFPDTDHGTVLRPAVEHLREIVNGMATVKK